MDFNEHIIGIDLGTTFSCVGIFIDGKVEIIKNKIGNNITPSFVSFTDTNILIGDDAKNNIESNPENTIYDIKRLMGCYFDEQSVQDDIKNFKFKVINKNGKPHIMVKYKNEYKDFSPEEISALILGEMKDIAEKHVGSKINKAVVTVPAYFNDNQRKATQNAGKIAGLDAIKIINEPTSASIAYGFEQEENINKNIIVYDFGGGTLDVTLLNINNGKYDIKATSGDTHFGGEDFTIRLTKYYIDIIKQKYDINMIDNNVFISIKNQCEKAKKILSFASRAKIEIAINKNIYRDYMTRDNFEILCHDLFEKSLSCVKQILSDSFTFRFVIDEIVLVGGTTRIPKIQQMLKDFFYGKKLNRTIDPDKAIAYGATIQGYILSGQKNERTNNIVLNDIIPLTIGIENSAGILKPIIYRNSKIPTKKSIIFTTQYDNQNNIHIKIYQGERALAKDCSYIGCFTFDKIEKKKRGKPKIEITLELDENCVLNVYAEDKNIKDMQKITLNYGSNRLTSHEIENMILDAEKYKIFDETLIELNKSKNRYEHILLYVKDILEDANTINILSQKEIDDITKDVNIEFIYLNNDNITKKDIDMREIKIKIKFMKSKIMPLLKEKYYEEQNNSTNTI
jgi:molecular chaperone DnaK (HSP70)